MLFKILFILGFIILSLYLIYITYKDRRLPYSISCTVYSLEKKDRWLFSSVMFAVALLIAPRLFELMNGSPYEFLSFLTILGIIGVGADPLVHGEKNIIHYVSAILMGVASQIIVWLNISHLMVLWLPYIIYTMYMDNGKWNMMVSEIVMALALCICGIIL